MIALRAELAQRQLLSPNWEDMLIPLGHTSISFWCSERQLWRMSSFICTLKCCIFVANAVHCSSCSHTFHLGEIITITPKILSSSSTINHQHETIIGFSFYHDCKPRCCCCRNSKFIDCSQLFSSYHMHIYILSSCTSHSQILCSALIFGLLMTLIKIKLM